MSAAQLITNPRVAIALAAVLVCFFLWMRSGKSQGDYDSFPNAFISKEDAGYDQSKLVIFRGGSPPPYVDVSGGRRAWPAYVHPQLPMRDGKPYLFPRMIVDGKVVSPPLPPNGKVFQDVDFQGGKPFLTADAEAILKRMTSKQ